MELKMEGGRDNNAVLSKRLKHLNWIYRWYKIKFLQIFVLQVQ